MCRSEAFKVRAPSWRLAAQHASGRAERPQRLEIRIEARPGPVLHVGGDRLFQIAYRGFGLAALRVGHRKEVQRLVVSGILAADAVEMARGAGGVPRVEGEGRGVEAFLDGLRFGGRRRDVALAETEVKPDAVEELALVREVRDHAAEQGGGVFVAVLLHSTDRPLVQADGLDVGGPQGLETGGGARRLPPCARARGARRTACRRLGHAWLGGTL